MKNFISGFLTAIILCMFILTANAAAEATIPVVFNASRIIVDGLNVDADNITYNGTTYVPLRAISELLDKDVDYDAETKTIYIGKSYLPDSFDINNPVPMGMTHTVNVDDWGYKYKLDLRIDEVIYKDQAYNMLKEANQFNEPNEGYEYILVKVTASNLDSEEPIDLNSFSFDIVSKDNATYEHESIVEPKPAFETTLYPGGTFTGYVAFEIKPGDEPKLKWSRSNDWFLLK